MKFKKDLPEAGSGAAYVKLKDGENVVGIFMGEPYDFHSVWTGLTYKEVPEGAPGAGFRFKINFITKEGANYVAKVFENGITAYRDLMTLNEDYPLETTAVRITRSGSTKQDTSYTFLPLPPSQQPTPQSLKVIAQVALISFSPPSEQKTGLGDSQDHNFGNAPMPDEHPETPF